MRLEIVAAHRASAAKIAAAAETAAEAGRGTEFRAGFPVRAQFVVFFPLGGIAKDFVGLVDFLEFLLGLLLVFRDVGMKFAGKFAEGFFDVGVAGGARDAENLVIIFVLNGHRP